jgi:ribosomal protein S18 acetylase RimI-like enzyme
MRSPPARDIVADRDEDAFMLQIVPVTSQEHFGEAWTLIAEMARWDAAESEQLGLNGQDVVAFFYPGGEQCLRSENVPPDGALLLATVAGAPAGCAAFRRMDSRACELHNVYVRTEFRGKGIARQLVQQLVQTARNTGYAVMRLETTPFMPEAQALYKSLGFQSRSAYRDVPHEFEPWTIFMELSLAS